VIPCAHFHQFRKDTAALCVSQGTASTHLGLRNPPTSGKKFLSVAIEALFGVSTETSASDVPFKLRLSTNDFSGRKINANLLKDLLLVETYRIPLCQGTPIVARQRAVEIWAIGPSQSTLRLRPPGDHIALLSILL